MRRLPGLALTALLAVGASACSDSGGRDDFCAALPDAVDVVTVLGDFDSDDSAALERRFAEGLDAFEALQDSAPDDVRDDVEAITAAVETILAAVRAHPDDTAAIREELADDAETLSEAAEAAEAVNAYARSECGIELTTVSTAPTPTAPTTAAPPTSGG